MNTLFRSLVLLPIALSAHGLPFSPEEIDGYVQRAQQSVLHTVEQITSSTHENKIRLWNRAGSELLVHFGLLTGLSESGMPVKNAAEFGMMELRDFLYQTFIQNPQLVHSLIDYTRDQLTMNHPNPYECYQMGFLLNSAKSISRFFPDEVEDSIYSLKALSDSFEQTPYLYLKGDALEKMDGGLSVFSLNTCFIPGLLAVMHGGMAPWEERVYALTDKIRSVNADIVCLQEVFTEDANLALYEALKGDYAHFYISIAPRPIGFSLQNLGLPSGLFVASKYPIERPAFTLYGEAGYPMNWGFFDFIVRGSDGTLGHIYTTHLQSLNEEGFAEIRAIQLQQLVDKIELDLYSEKEKMPYFLCGDLNIPYGSGEIGERVIRENFYDDYNRDEQPVNEQNRTCTSFFTNSLLSPAKVDPEFLILDYALLLDDSACEGYEIDTVQVEMNSLSDPQRALSDHHGLLTYIITP